MHGYLQWPLAGPSPELWGDSERPFDAAHNNAECGPTGRNDNKSLGEALLDASEPGPVVLVLDLAALPEEPWGDSERFLAAVGSWPEYGRAVGNNSKV